MGLFENSVPLNPMVLLIIIPIKWLFHWEYTQHFQTNPYVHSPQLHGTVPTCPVPLQGGSQVFVAAASHLPGGALVTASRSAMYGADATVD